MVKSVCLRGFCVNMNVGYDICMFRVGLWYDRLLWVVLFRCNVR